MFTPTTLIPTAEAAFIAGLSQRQMNRVLDEHLVPDVLFVRQGGTRLFTRLCSAFAKFYFDNEGVLVAQARRQVLDELTHRVEQRSDREHLLALHSMPENMNWKVAKLAVEIDVAPYVSSACARSREIDQADALITSDPEIMGGAFVFAGSRVPVDVVLASADAGVEWARLRASYPFMTSAHLTAARVHLEVNPRRGRPRFADVQSTQRGAHTARVIRPARA